MEMDYGLSAILGSKSPNMEMKSKIENGWRCFKKDKAHVLKGKVLA